MYAGSIREETVGQFSLAMYLQMMASEIVFQELTYGDALHAASIGVRDRILRKPLGMEFSPEDLVAECTDRHLGALYCGEVIGVVLMRPQDAGLIKMRQVAIDIPWQRSGIGRGLVGFSERFAIDHGFTRIILHARKSAVPFYEKLGYSIEGEEFIEIGIAHFNMFKDI